MDPLEVLCQTIARKGPIQYDDASGIYTLGNKTFPANAETSWKSLKGPSINLQKTKKKKKYFYDGSFIGKGEPYKIGAVVLLWQMQNSPYAEYYNEAQKRNIQSVLQSAIIFFWLGIIFVSLCD